MWIQSILAAEVVIAPARVEGAATGVRHIEATGLGLCLLLFDFLLCLFLDVLFF